MEPVPVTFDQGSTLLVEVSIPTGSSLSRICQVQSALTFKCLSDFTGDSSKELSRIAAPLTSMLKTSGSTESTIRPGKGGVGVGVDSNDDGGHDEEH